MRKMKVLIVEDEELLRDLYVMILDSEFDCEIITATNGEEAILLLSQSIDVDLIISDYTMPKAHGGAVYLYNKAHQNLPFVLISAGDISDYLDFKDFLQSNPLNKFINKPFSEELLVAHLEKIREHVSLGSTTNFPDDSFVKILLSHYAKYSTSASELYLKLGDNKYTKIVNSNVEDIPDAKQIAHYLSKGIDYVYIKKNHFSNLLKGAFQIFENQLQSERKTTSFYETNGIQFQISYEGLNSIGINSLNIASVNEIIDETLAELFNDSETKEQFSRYCETESFLIGHSLLIIYIAGKLCKEAQLGFHSTMKRMVVSSFFHDISLSEMEERFHEINFSKIADKKILERLLGHPAESAKYLPEFEDMFEETKKIILEHQEMPDGSGYPKGLDAYQISPLSCLFILSEQITFCLIRNNFNSERLRDFLLNSEKMFSQGNFTKFYKAAITSFGKNR